MDNKYGRIFTASDVQAIIEYVVYELASDQFDDPDLVRDEAGKLITEALSDDADIRFKFGADEPLFILRGRDKRAAGAIKHYRDHQSPQAPPNHLDAIDKAFTAFNTYREENPGMMKEPD